MSPTDRTEIKDLINRFYRLVDSGKADETVDLFTPDARLNFGPGAPQPGTIEGAAIGQAMQARAQVQNVVTRHVLTNFAFEQTGADTASVTSLLTLYRHDGPLGEGIWPNTIPASIADVQEKVVRTGDGWRICERVISPIFNRPAAAA